jgi:hypothetical protein
MDFNKQMSDDLKFILNKLDKTVLYIGLVLLLIFFIFAYIYTTLKKKERNCETISKSGPFYTIAPLTNYSEYSSSLESPIKDFYIKTAYNCCCTGNLKNDYVDNCALLKCADFGVRALDFQIYSKFDTPIISASSLPNTEITNFKYKELYNSLLFSDTMKTIKEHFLLSPNCNNKQDPLFLIFRLYTNKKNVMDKMYETLYNTFNSYIYTTNAEFDNIKLNEIMSKVIIIIEKTPICVNYNNSKLKNIVALELGNTTNKIYRERDIVSYMSSDPEISANFRNINLLYPEISGNVENYDAVTIAKMSGIQFIAMNYQLNDEYLQQVESNLFKDKGNNNSFSMVLKSSIPT